VNDDQTKGKLDEFNARVKRKWGELTDDEIKQAEGNVDLLSAKIRQRYGESKEAIAKQINELRNE